MSLSAEQMRAALDALASWRADPETAVACPLCTAAGLTIVDRSARPYAEWYQLTCSACALDETIHIPLAPPVMGGYD